MSLTRLIRTRFKSILAPCGLFLARAGLTPNFLSGLGLGTALIAGFLFALKPTQPYLAAIAIIISGMMDLLDGAVARHMPHFSGSLNDSILDRISEIAIFAGIVDADYMSPVIVLMALGISLTTSYLAAKGGSLGISMSHNLGLAQRAERLAPIVIFALLDYVWVGVYISLILSAITFTQRYAYVIRSTSTLGS
jgi:archaetidylinositol phosphate synthase